MVNDKLFMLDVKCDHNLVPKWGWSTIDGAAHSGFIFDTPKDAKADAKAKIGGNDVRPGN